MGLLVALFLTSAPGFKARTEIPCVHASLPTCDGFLILTFDMILAGCFMASVVAKPF